MLAICKVLRSLSEVLRAWLVALTGCWDFFGSEMPNQIILLGLYGSEQKLFFNLTVRLHVLSHVNHGCYCWKMLLTSVWTESLNTYRF